MDNWKEIRLGDYIIDIAAGPFGSNLKVECFVSTGFPIIDGANLKGYKVTDNITKFVTKEKAYSLHRSIAHRKDVIVTISGTLGQIAYIPDSSKYDEYLCSQRQFRVTFDQNKIDVPYLVYFFHGYEGQHKILSFANQVGVPALSQPLKNFRDIELFLPSLTTQRKIARILSSLDDKIELNNKINDNLEQQAQAIFKSWFVDFEPFGGEMPEGWKVGKLSEIAEITMGQSPDGSSYNEDGNGTVFYQGRAEFGIRFPTRRLFTTDPRRMAKKYDTLMSVRAPVGDTNIANEDCCIGRGLAAIHSKDNHQSFVHYSVLSTSKQLEVFNGEGTVFGCISKDGINNLEIVIPSKTEIDKFESIVASFDAEIFNRSEENKKLSNLRETLLPKLMSGDLDVDKVEL